MRIKYILLSILLTFLFNVSFAGFSEAQKNFNNAQRTSVKQDLINQNDAVVIFDRLYVQYGKTENGEVMKTTTVHRKIQINTLHALESLNKIYIPLFISTDRESKLLSCKAQALKENNTVVLTDDEELRETTLPANVPFFYKKEGKVKMLAVRDLELGDQLEYIYSYSEVFDILQRVFSDVQFYECVDDFYILEKTFRIMPGPYSFKYEAINEENSENNLDDYFTEKEDYVISFFNLKPKKYEIYDIPHLREPGLWFKVKYYAEKTNTDEWEDILSDIKVTNKERRQHGLFDETSFYSLKAKIDSQSVLSQKMEIIKDLINSDIEDNLSLYYQLREDITAQWGYIEVISKTMAKLNLPIQFHLTKNKLNGTIDTSFKSIYQFDKVFLSYEDAGKRHYLPILEPFSDFGDVGCYYDGNPCITINQDEKGKSIFFYENIPMSDDFGKILCEVESEINEVNQDSLSLDLNYTLRYTGKSFIKNKAVFNYFVTNKDSSWIKDDIISFFYDEFYTIRNKDSVSLVDISIENNNELVVSFFCHDFLEVNRFEEEHFIYPSYFFPNNFNIPLSQKINRQYSGYLFNEDAIQIDLNIQLNLSSRWIVDDFANASFSNKFGEVSSSFTVENKKLNYTAFFNLGKDFFTKEEFADFLKLRDEAFTVFNRNLFYSSVSH